VVVSPEDEPLPPEDEPAVEVEAEDAVEPLDEPDDVDELEEEAVGAVESVAKPRASLSGDPAPRKSGTSVGGDFGQ